MVSSPRKTISTDISLSDVRDCIVANCIGSSKVGEIGKNSNVVSNEGLKESIGTAYLTVPEEKQSIVRDKASQFAVILKQPTI